MIRRPPRSTLSSSSAASDVYKRQVLDSSTTTTTAGFTLQYLSPEQRNGRSARPTPQSDMYAFGLAALLCCCWRNQDAYSFAHTSGELLHWSHEMAGAVDPHLPPLLKHLLCELPTARLSATQVLLHPFVDMHTERLLAAEATRAAELTEAAAAEAQLMLVHERERLGREMQWKEAEQRRQLEQEEMAMRADLEQVWAEVLERQKETREARVRIEARQAELDDEQRARDGQVEYSQQLEQDQQAAREEIRGLEEEMARQHKRLEAQRKKLAKLKDRKRATPSYWKHRTGSKLAAGFAVVPVTPDDEQVWEALQLFLATDPQQLSKGRDVAHLGSYDRLQMVRAWRVEHPGLWDRYAAGQAQVQRDMKSLKRDLVPRPQGLPPVTAPIASKLPASLNAMVNETYLLHGTSPQNLLSLLSTGPNERFAGTNRGAAFGDGTYFAEDAGKTDQYVTADAEMDPGSELHALLYPDPHPHPGSVFYVLVCRVSLGQSVRTLTDGQNCRSMDDDSRVFPVSYRELASVPGVSPPVHFHSLIAEVGGALARFREFVVFHSEYVYPEYLVAYQRFHGQHGQVLL
eukprot:TRINITY_DN1663_c0_g5_i1.p1 TRINITY_DN1663_c0_g5~~TRINITY_DN1663_c0_g5_i1.p1  ORF type:complete len:575 (-),score=166.73 TRINITY_DN1663_c0_g5_i1:72-1796(-)